MKTKTIFSLTAVLSFWVTGFAAAESTVNGNLNNYDDITINGDMELPEDSSLQIGGTQLMDSEVNGNVDVESHINVNGGVSLERGGRARIGGLKLNNAQINHDVRLNTTINLQNGIHSGGGDIAVGGLEIDSGEHSNSFASEGRSQRRGLNEFGGVGGGLKRTSGAVSELREQPLQLSGSGTGEVQSSNDSSSWAKGAFEWLKTSPETIDKVASRIPGTPEGERLKEALKGMNWAAEGFDLTTQFMQNMENDKGVVVSGGVALLQVTDVILDEMLSKGLEKVFPVIKLLPPELKQYITPQFGEIAQGIVDVGDAKAKMFEDAIGADSTIEHSAWKFDRKTSDMNQYVTAKLLYDKRVQKALVKEGPEAAYKQIISGADQYINDMVDITAKQMDLLKRKKEETIFFNKKRDGEIYDREIDTLRAGLDHLRNARGNLEAIESSPEVLTAIKKYYNNLVNATPK